MSNESLGTTDTSRLKEAALQLEALIESAIDGIIVIDQQATIETINPAAATLFGYKAEEVIGKNIKMLMPEPYHSEHDEYVARYHRTGEARIIGIGREVRGLKKNGIIFPLRLAVSKIDLEGRVRYTGIIHDLSDVKAAEAKILRLNRELEQKVVERTETLAMAVDRLLKTNRSLEQEMEQRQQAESSLRKREVELQSALEKERELSELKSRFVSMASHEFRTPLSTVLSSVELVEMYAANSEQAPKQQRHIDRIKSAVHALTSILNDFLSLSRLEEGHIQARLQDIAIEAFCQEIIESVGVQLKSGQQIELHHLGGPEKWRIDPNLLRNILFNLLSNAIKYSVENSLVRVELSADEKNCILRVIDQGIGIPEADQKHLFTRFFRAHNVENIKGTGLGLHIVRRYVDLLGGSIEFESTLGVGSIFTVHLPLSGTD